MFNGVKAALLVSVLGFLFPSTGLAAAYTLPRADGSLITYYLDAKVEAQRGISAKNLLVLIQGSSCNSVRHNSRVNQSFSKLLLNADLLTVEKYGIDAGLNWSENAERDNCPAAYLRNDSPLQRLTDYEQVLETVLAQQLYQQVVVLGGSEGALIANMLATRSKHVDFVISINGGARWFLDDVLHSIKAQTGKGEATQAAINGFKGFSQHILNSPPSDLQVSGHGYHWWRQMLEIDQHALLQQIELPLLIVQSGQDKSVSAEKARSMVESLLPQQSNLSLYYYPSLDHQLLTAEGHSKEAEVIADIKRWLADVGRQ